jgi:hypothetical protein
MAINKVEIYVSQILEDLDNGLTWLKKDDLGYGSIQDKYNAKEQQIAMIRKHPALKDAETTVTVFTVIDDTKNNNNAGTTTNDTSVRRDEINLESLPKTNIGDTRSTDTSVISQGNNQTAIRITAESGAESDLAAFANL